MRKEGKRKFKKEGSPWAELAGGRRTPAADGVRSRTSYNNASSGNRIAERSAEPLRARRPADIALQFGKRVCCLPS